MKSDRDYIIPFVGLKAGIHEFEFDITDSFFEDIEYSIIEKGKLKVHLALEKKETMMIGEYSVSGVVGTTCDRCSDPVDVELTGEYRLIYKFDDKPSDDESLIVVYPEEFEINVKDSILELITVSIPSRALHEEGECNEEMMDILEEYAVYSIPEESTEEVEDEGPIDPRWEALKKLRGE